MRSAVLRAVHPTRDTAAGPTLYGMHDQSATSETHRVGRAYSTKVMSSMLDQLSSGKFSSLWPCVSPCDVAES